LGNADPKAHNHSHWNEDPSYATNRCGDWFNSLQFGFGFAESWFYAGVDSWISYSFGGKNVVQK
jgi:hypothetical protein